MGKKSSYRLLNVIFEKNEMKLQMLKLKTFKNILS